MSLGRPEKYWKTKTRLAVCLKISKKKLRYDAKYRFSFTDFLFQVYLQKLLNCVRTMNAKMVARIKRSSEQLSRGKNQNHSTLF